MSKIDEIYNALKELEVKSSEGITASELSTFMNLDRANVSRYLNQLYKDGAVNKIEGHPVKYSCVTKNEEKKSKEIKKTYKEIKRNTLDTLVGAKLSLQMPIQQAKAAILYPPRGITHFDFR